MPGIFTRLPPLLPGSWLPFIHTTKITGGGLIKSLSCPQPPADSSGRIASNGHSAYCPGVMAQTSLQPFLCSVLQQKSSHGFAEMIRQRDSRIRTHTPVYVSLHLFRLILHPFKHQRQMHFYLKVCSKPLVSKKWKRLMPPLSGMSGCCQAALGYRNAPKLVVPACATSLTPGPPEAVSLTC